MRGGTLSIGPKTTPKMTVFVKWICINCSHLTLATPSRQVSYHLIPYPPKAFSLINAVQDAVVSGKAIHSHLSQFSPAFLISWFPFLKARVACRLELGELLDGLASSWQHTENVEADL